MKVSVKRALILTLMSAIFWCRTAHAGEAFRKPFDLHLRVDKEHYYEQHFDRMPYVADETAFLFNGDKFGIRLTGKTDANISVDYEPELSKADLVFNFGQRPANEGALMMLLIIENRTDKTIHMEGLMTVPGEKSIFKTSILPVGTKKTNFESWPHPIVQLALRNFKIQ